MLFRSPPVRHGKRSGRGRGTSFGESTGRGGSALFLQVKDGDPGPLVGVLGQFHGRVYQTSYDDDIEQAIDQSMR